MNEVGTYTVTTTGIDGEPIEFSGTWKSFEFITNKETGVIENLTIIPKVLNLEDIKQPNG